MTMRGRRGRLPLIAPAKGRAPSEVVTFFTGLSR
jgi:hypothetical protein